MNKFRFLLTRSNEKGNNSVKNSIPQKQMVMLLRNECYALLLQIHQELILFTQNYFCWSVFDSSPVSAWPPSAWAFLPEVDYVYLTPF